jgi:murein DD-endopeptidase MepM/ murein hydrolase activator NlpD
VRSSRHVGQVIDPLVREDGIDEPQVVDPAANDDEGGLLVPRRVSGARSDASGESESGHPVRDRLLARAAAARGSPDVEADQASSSPEVLRTFTDELDRIASRAAPPLPPSGLSTRRPELPPNVVALFATLLGLALMAALFAVLIHLDPRDGTPIERTPALATATVTSAPAPSPPPSASVSKPERHRVPGPWRVADSTDPKLKKVEGSIGHESFLKALEGAGIASAQTFRLLAVLKSLRDLDHCNPRDQFAALIDRASSRVVGFEYVVSKEEVYQAREGEGGLLKATRLDLLVERNRVQGAIRFDRDTFTASLEAAGFEPSLVSVIDDALAGHSAVAELRRGDRVRLVAEEVTVLGELERYAGIEALEVLSAHGDEKPLRIYYFKGPQSHGYFDAEGRSVHEGDWHKPIKGAPITSHFNPKRMHPILHKIMPHEGTDMGAPMGTPVGAAGPGVVKFIGNGGPGGNLVVIQHAAGLETGYAHLSRFEPGLKVGDHVTPMQIVGYVGSTGRSTGPHLHFSVKKNGVFVDAEATLRFDSLRGMPLAERVEFTDARTKLDALLDAIALPPALDEAPPKASAAPVEEPSDELGSEPAPRPDAPAASSAAGNAPPPSAPATPSPPGPSPAPAKGSSIYVTDQELQKGQAATDDGEVNE